MWVHQPTLFLGFGAPLWIDAQEAPVNKTRKQLSVLHRFIYSIIFFIDRCSIPYTKDVTGTVTLT
jgi:hypothetical protein